MFDFVNRANEKGESVVHAFISAIELPRILARRLKSLYGDKITDQPMLFLDKVHSISRELS